MAAQRAQAEAPALAKPTGPAPATTPARTAPTLVNPFSVTASEQDGTPGFQFPDNREFAALVGYPRYAVRINQAQARKVIDDTKENQENGGCRQRKIYRSNIEEIKQGMELGEWALNPADSLVFCKEHGSVVNGQHRLRTLGYEAEAEFIEAFYPKEGVPFYVTFDFPCALSHIFDQGKKRNTTDAADFAGLEGWGSIPSAALKLVHQFDESFREGGEQNWMRWSKQLYTNTEKTHDMAVSYGDLLNNAQLVSRAYRRSKITRSSSMAAAFLIDRDNPGGWNPVNKHTSILFWKGVCGDDTMEVGDPRMALVRVAMRTGAKKRVDNGPTMLAHILKQYANYMIGGKKVDMSVVNTSQPMPPVWQPGMKWIRTDGIPLLRHPHQ
jgi:hypothetical protein